MAAAGSPVQPVGRAARAWPRRRPRSGWPRSSSRTRWSEVAAAAEAVLKQAAAAPRQAASSRPRSCNAFREFDREVSGQLDVRLRPEDDVFLVEVAGVGDERTLAGAARTLAARVESGRAALSEREREVFTRFVLGGVAEELRRRVNQADQLVGAMNTSLKGIRTSNGIGVRLGWGLREDHTALGRILELVATSDAVRSEAAEHRADRTAAAAGRGVPRRRSEQRLRRPPGRRAGLPAVARGERHHPRAGGGPERADCPGGRSCPRARPGSSPT